MRSEFRLIFRRDEGSTRYALVAPGCPDVTSPSRTAAISIPIPASFWTATADGASMKTILKNRRFSLGKLLPGNAKAYRQDQNT